MNKETNGPSTAGSMAGKTPTVRLALRCKADRDNYYKELMNTDSLEEMVCIEVICDCASLVQEKGAKYFVQRFTNEFPELAKEVYQQMHNMRPQAKQAALFLPKPDEGYGLGIEGDGLAAPKEHGEGMG